MTRKKRQDSIVKEAWDNMRSDMAGLVPERLSGRLGTGKRRWVFFVIVTLVELLLLGALGKVLYDWLFG